jgi:hypothetical protein
MTSYDVMWLMRAYALTAGALVSGCNTEPEPMAAPPAAPFQFATVTEGALDVSIRDAAGPIAGARLFISGDAERAAPDDAGAAAELLWQGMSGSDGHARGKLVSRMDVDHVTLLVTADGFEGPYDDESVRTAHGPFAPAAMVTVSFKELAGYNLKLARVGSGQ